MCHVSRVTFPRQVGCVTVRVPPDIDESLSSGDVAVAEGANTTLSCVTRGQPQYVARVYLMCATCHVSCAGPPSPGSGRTSRTSRRSPAPDSSKVCILFNITVPPECIEFLNFYIITFGNLHRQQFISTGGSTEKAVVLVAFSEYCTLKESHSSGFPNVSMSK